jgi:hypothetical protein
MSLVLGRQRAMEMQADLALTPQKCIQGIKMANILDQK